jgi:hypothetical protein
MKPRTQQKHEDCLYWYFQIIKDMGAEVQETNLSVLYAYAGKMVYLSDKHAAKIIRKLLRNRDAVIRASERVK